MTRRPRGFSLIEVLMAIMILGIGVISVAALFPAGIAQQRQSTDDIFGPIVAENAITILRTKLDAADFGTFEDFTPFGSSVRLFPPRPTIPGDWTWLRPGAIFADDPSASGHSPDVDEQGAIDIFSALRTINGAAPDWANEFDTTTSGYEDGVTASAPELYGIPWNRGRYGDVPPVVLVTQRERYYPMPPPSVVNGAPVRPEYVWDCMFRRFQGRILVAIFVYRVRAVGGENVEYHLQPDPGSAVPPIPVWVDLDDPSGGSEPWRGHPWESNRNPPEIDGTYPGDEFDLTNAAHAWQLPGQWILDQNNGTHRVLAGRTSEDEGPVELVRPVPQMRQNPDPTNPAGNVGVYYFPPLGSTGNLNWNVSDIWFLPLTVVDPATEREFRLTPVFVSVKEL